jgi:hypothetical protein
VEFMLLFAEPEGAVDRDPAGMAEMTRYSRELAGQRVLRCGAPLEATWGATVRVRDGQAFTSDGPFAESKEVVGGFWIIDVPDRAAAVEVARRSPHARHGAVEVHALRTRFPSADPEVGTPFLLAFRREPGLKPEEAKYQEMIAFSENLRREGTVFDIAPLASDPPPARIQPARGGRTLVTDGPFAESKEGIGGYALVRTADRAHAIELATRYPHARWGPVEVREILFFDPV